MFGKVIIRAENGEDAEAMLARYVELRGKFPFEPAENVGVEVFRTMAKGDDVGMRGEAAARAWEFDLGIQERIRLVRIGGGDKPQEVTEDQIVAELAALARNERFEAKDRIAAYGKIADIKGLVVKKVDSKTSNIPPPPARIVFKQADFDQDPEGEDEEGDDDEEAPGAVAAA